MQCKSNVFRHAYTGKSILTVQMYSNLRRELNSVDNIYIKMIAIHHVPGNNWWLTHFSQSECSDNYFSMMSLGTGMKFYYPKIKRDSICPKET